MYFHRKEVKGAKKLCKPLRSRYLCGEKNMWESLTFFGFAIMNLQLTLYHATIQISP